MYYGEFENRECAHVHIAVSKAIKETFNLCHIFLIERLSKRAQMNAFWTRYLPRHGRANL